MADGRLNQLHNHAGKQLARVYAFSGPSLPGDCCASGVGLPVPGGVPALAIARSRTYLDTIAACTHVSSLQHSFLLGCGPVSNHVRR
jgi:hypothetical protein